MVKTNIMVCIDLDIRIELQNRPEINISKIVNEFLGDFLGLHRENLKEKALKSLENQVKVREIYLSEIKREYDKKSKTADLAEFSINDKDSEGKYINKYMSRNPLRTPAELEELRILRKKSIIEQLEKDKLEEEEEKKKV